MQRFLPRLLPAVLLLSVLGAAAGYAATPSLHPNLVRGEGDAGRYDSDGPATIDLFSGNLMLEIPLGQRYAVDARLGYRFALRYNSRIWDFSDTGSAEAVAFSNAGLGFDLGFGRLVPPAAPGDPWIYVAEDGRPHRFYADLRDDSPDTDDPADRFFYTRDGSYLRLHLLGPSLARVEFPDGTFRELSPVGGEWRARTISSRDGAHRIDLTYAQDDSTWTLVDSWGRTQIARFVPDPADPGRRLLDSLELSAFGGARATYRLTYAQIEVPRACGDPRGGVATVSVLASLLDPVGFERTFTYHGAGSDCLDGGRLETAMLATGGVMAFDYGAYEFPSPACESSAPPHLSTVSGVVERQHRHPLGQEIGTWRYEPQDVLQGCAANERRTAKITPLGDRFIYYFGVGSDGASAGDAADYALPISDV
ncbi:MAG: hypothetical protein MI919_38705, partial [Holophagales bacterium]|nr:hypothetical protein [Holophagales bacterium]